MRSKKTVAVVIGAVAGVLVPGTVGVARAALPDAGTSRTPTAQRTDIPTTPDDDPFSYLNGNGQSPLPGQLPNGFPPVPGLTPPSGVPSAPGAGQVPASGGQKG
ncbi:hypothetical protein DPM19_20025 [Actinomadura craniellae]|uniref:Uncharacterized protein n=1 Tax=Actinomadura craniellae TaxID=2231787 RepID=A0A365H560_9ACTN|nr:hypothetical protein [Actinomadura craniellae]RAY13363.1 hypothetical protein DPM19_20025 [Actinomadura craniellae]